MWNCPNLNYAYINFLARNCQDWSRSHLKWQEYNVAQVLSCTNRGDRLLFSLQTHAQVGLVWWSPSDSPWRHSEHTACALLRPAKSLPMVCHYETWSTVTQGTLNYPQPVCRHDAACTTNAWRKFTAFQETRCPFTLSSGNFAERKSETKKRPSLIYWLDLFHLVYLSIFLPFLPLCNSFSKLSLNCIF